jgi:hypothetical protein
VRAHDRSAPDADPSLMSTTLHPAETDSLRARAFELAAVVEQLTDGEFNELHAAVLERLTREVDLQGLQPFLRPLLNRVLDVLDRSSLGTDDVAQLSRIVFACARR